ncbi:hypothetical protein GIY23_03740 [Allosaccharopolyspora coralli]|uniref:SseB protein N-terminal domain-containing protein n=1 Tax=Allosaccharopolyspora coralli TaxID=2665642 RepID=A0A5Q3QDC0_9PSEU|nr:SAV_915 family protein [Allosaccharopolyspora coralli]QGK68777.1 hypothetical protein GIY23_03740 [Allosaccharopolyspora coralli]
MQDNATGATAPNVAYVPSRPVGSGDSEATLELRETGNGDLALLAFTSRDKLAECCGRRQSCIGVRPEQVDELRSRSGAAVVLWDPAPTSDQRDDS